MSQKIEFEKLRNTRDLGGMVTADGRKIKTGKLIRSGHLIAASENDQQKLAKLIDTVVDFRSEKECTERPEPYICGTKYYHIPVLEAPKPGVTRDEDSYEEVRKNMLGESELSRKYMVRVYGGFITSEHCRSQYERFVRLLLEDHSKAVLWHCTAGKDRAGFGTVIVQELLGISKTDIMDDYLLTNTYLEPEIQGIIESIRKKTGFMNEESEKALRYMFAAWQDYLEGAYSLITEHYRNFDGYIRDGLHITDTEREKLRNMYLE